MKRKIIVALLLILTMISSLFAFTGCGDKESGEKQVPVYQGMTITNANTATMSLMSSGYRSGGIMLLSANKENNGDNGNHNGHYKGDHTDRDDAIDEDNPYPDNNKNENIEEEIKSSLNVIGSPDTIYYAEPNQDIYINIHIDNPDNFEIMSFTLNGKKYSSYMFEEGSDMETIVLKYNVGDTAGIVEYTIDAIKYIDGTEIKDVIIDGNKTVMAGVKTQNQVSANISNLNIGTNALAFDANIKDNNALIEFSKGALKAVLYDGFSIVAEKDLITGDNTVTFDGLKTNTLYQYAVVGYYDNLSGNGFAMNVLYKDAFYTDSVVLFDNITVGQEGISFSFLWHEDHQNKSISALKLYKEDTFVKNIDANATSISELLSNTTYKLVAEYPNGNNTESIYLEFTTLAKATPEIAAVTPTTTQTSIGFEISETDADNVGAITKIELVHANGTVVADSLDQRAFANLLSNNAYTVKVTYVYNLNDGEGEHTVTKELAITTEAKTAPSFVVKNESITTNSMNAQCDITDVDNILSSYKVELYKDNTFVSDNSDKAIDFTGLDYYTDYTVKISYTYDLNDGNGNQTATYSYAFKTLPYIDVTECSIANTSAVSEGETIFMSVKLDNPLGMSVESVVINGETYKVTGASTKNKIFVEIIYNGQFAGGDTHLKVDKVNAKIDNSNLSVEPKSELSDNVFINGKLEVLKIEFVNEEFKPIDWAFPSDTVYVLITLDNPTGYTIDRINNQSNSWTVIDANRLYRSVSLSNGWNDTYVQSVDFHNQYISKTLSFTNMQARCYQVASNEVKYISNADDLKNMDNGFYYELTNDIDLSNMEWHGNSFEGVFDGKGYSIKNMTYVGTVTNQNVYLGLFTSHPNGVIKNVQMTDILCIVELNSTDNQTYTLVFGAIAGGPYTGNPFVKLENCATDENSTIILKNNTGSSGAAGGLIGECVNAEIVNCVNMADLTTHNISGVGGIVGGCYHGTFIYCENSGDISGENAGGIIGVGERPYVIGCNNSGAISGTNYVGGIIGVGSPTVSECVNSGIINCQGYSAGGILGGGGAPSISDCINLGDVSGLRLAGGISGGASGSSGQIVNCINAAMVSGNESCGSINGVNYESITNCLSISPLDLTLTGHNFAGGSIVNSYSTYQYDELATGVSIEQLNSKEFYTETLGWSEDIWDFSDLDVENGKYPRLKQ